MSKNNKRKWEKDYEKYSTMNLDDEIKKIEGEVNNLRTSQAGIKDTTSKEYKDGKTNQKAKESEIKKLKALKQNMPQVKNVVEQKKKLEEKLKKLYEQKKEVEDTKKLSGKSNKLEEDLKKLLEEENKIKETPKNPKLTDEQKSKLQTALDKNTLAQKENHNEFSDTQQKLTEKLNSPLQKRNFDKEIQATKNLISKFNFIGRNLMEGKRMQEITTDLSKWEDKKFTDKERTAKYKKENSKTEEPEKQKISKPEKTSDSEKGKTTKKVEEKEENIEGYEEAIKKEIKKEDKDLIKVSEFDEKHPRIAKIKDFFKGMGTKAKSTYEKVKDKLIRNAEEKEEVPKKGEAKKQEEKSSKQVEGKLTAEEIAQKKAEFCKKIAETGKYSDTPNNSKMTEALSKQAELSQSTQRAYKEKNDGDER